MSDIIYTRNILKSLKEENDRKIHENNVQQLVNQITNNVISKAAIGITTSYVYSIMLPSNTEDSKYKIIIDVIEKLKEKFIDISIEYKSQTDIKTGKEFNHGIYIDWT
jgi:hypothetical protein